MLSAARCLTWIENVEPLRDAGKTLLQWINESAKADQPNSSAQVAVIAEEFMRAGFRRPLVDALGAQVSLIDATSSLRSLMRHKSPGELAVLRAACEILESATKAFKKAHRSGTSVTAAVLASEHVAIHAGAQDVRTLMSLDGGRTLRPFDELLHHVVDPLQLYVALRHAGYWVEGFVCSSQSPNPALIKAADALRALSRDASAGTTGATLFAIAANAIAPYRSHTMTQEKIGNSIGLALEAEPILQVDSAQSLEDGDVCSLCVGATDGGDHHAIVSALIAVKQNGCDVLWSAV
jgi:Xaa-Pro aminopeptidase